MLENLIFAYRDKFYSHNFKKIIAFYCQNKKKFWGSILFLLIYLCVMIYSAVSRTIVWTLSLALIVLIIAIVTDQQDVRKHQSFISSRQNHLYDVLSLLETTIPNFDLFSTKQIEELIDRLSIRIEIGTPWNKFKSSLYSFGKAIVFPIITYIAGVYTTSIRELGFQFIFSCAIIIILLIILLWLICKESIQTFQEFFCKNYYATIAFKEDLLDIKLLFFSDDTK